MCVYVFSLSLLPHFVCFVRILLFVVVVLTSETTCVRRGAKMKNCQAFSFPHIKIGVKSSIMGGKTELTTIKTLMEITGQNKEDVQSVLQKFGGDEALAVSELMCSTCNHHLSYLIFHVLAGKSSFFCEALCSSTRAKTDPLRLFFPKLQCISSWT